MNNIKAKNHKLFKELTVLNYKAMYTKLDKIGVYPGQPVILEVIYENKGISQGKLAELVMKEPATITTMLNRMEHLRFIERKPDDFDKRIVRLYLTSKGRKCYRKIKEVIEEFMNNNYQNITEEELMILYKVLGKIKNNLLKNK